MAAPTPPIEISRSSTSPRNQSSNLTSGLREAARDNTNTNAVDIASAAPRPPPSRQDSLNIGGHNMSITGTSFSGARPISVNRRRESNTGGGSLMNGMSWGGLSVGSLMQDDIMMTGTSPYNVGSPSFHSSSYFPKMEANFWNNLRCCEIGFSDLHDLLQHFEEVHQQAPSNFPSRMSLNSGGSFGKFPRRKSSNLGMSNGLGTSASDLMKPSHQVRGFQPGVTSNGTGMSQSRSQQGMQDMDTIGEMEMDEDDSSSSGIAAANAYNAANSTFGMPDNKPGALNTGLANMIQSQQAFNASDSNPATPTVNRPTHSHLGANPMVSSVNTPQMSNRTSSDSEPPDTPINLEQALANQFNPNDPMANFDPQTLQKLNAEFGDLNFSNGLGSDMPLDLCINDPAKALFSENGNIDTSQFPNFGYLSGPPGTDENARRLQARQLALGRGVLAGEEDRPFKCPVIGCEKAYKNANGLRYHEKHGHSNQKLKQNDDGTFSIVDPLTSIPYPGTVGMEKEKPYRCDVCGKRYKNLNGLKYHRNHSPPCNPDFNFNNVSLPGMPNNAANEGVFT